MTHEEFIKEKIAENINLIKKQVELMALNAMKSNEYNFNDTAVRAKTFLLVADAIDDILKELK